MSTGISNLQCYLYFCCKKFVLITDVEIHCKISAYAVSGNGNLQIIPYLRQNPNSLPKLILLTK